MATHTPYTTLLVEHVASQLTLVQPPAYRTSIGTAVSTERPQALAAGAPFCSVRLVAWEVVPDTTLVTRDCELRIEAVLAASDNTAEDLARDAAEDIHELFRAVGASVALGAAQAAIGAVSGAEIERPEGSDAVLVSLTLRAQIYEP
jgi:hypothetical protein